MKLNNPLVYKNWGEAGVSIVQAIADKWGIERLPEPDEGNTLETYVRRCAALGLCHVSGDMHRLGDVIARRKAEDAGLPVFEVTDEADAATVAEQAKLDATRSTLHELSPTERFTKYREVRDDLLSK